MMLRCCQLKQLFWQISKKSQGKVPDQTDLVGIQIPTHPWTWALLTSEYLTLHSLSDPKNPVFQITYHETATKKKPRGHHGNEMKVPKR
jgi:hypothetical protein